VIACSATAKRGAAGLRGPARGYSDRYGSNDQEQLQSFGRTDLALALHNCRPSDGDPCHICLRVRLFTPNVPPREVNVKSKLMHEVCS